jgi:hypothetical protein
MSNGVSYPVLRTSDPAAALSAARRLLALGWQEYARVSVDVELCTVAEVEELRRSLPDAWFRTESDEFWAREYGNTDPGFRCDWHAAELTGDADELTALLPVWASMLDQPVGSIEDHFTAQVGTRYGTVRWEGLAWPEVPEHTYDGRIEHDGVTVVFNCNDPGTDRQAGTHTVCVDVQRTEQARSYAVLLAGRIGRTVIGPPYR